MFEGLHHHRAEIEALCRALDIRSLWVFGSALRDDFDPRTSDIDFLADLGDTHPRPARQFHELREGLERILGRTADVTSIRGVRNPYFRAELESTRQPLYLAA